MAHYILLRGRFAVPFITRNINNLHRSTKIKINSKKPCMYKTHDARRFLQTTSKRLQVPKTPDLIYMPQILRWMKSKLRFKYLKRIWDPEFSEGAFIYGTTQAVCKITEIIHQDKPEELNGLMTVSARIKLQDDIAYRLTPNQKNIILVKPEDIKILIPINVSFIKEGLTKVCRVALRVLALKWHEQANENYKLVLVALQAEFSRDYSEEAPPEWIISGFSVLECAMLTEATATR